jgi:choline dehydrogenase
MDSYDYVVVGAGSAGCVLANRLSEDPGVRVLLVEAGGKDRSPNIRIPAAFAKQFKTKLDWAYETEPEPGLEDRNIFMPRGKGLGGSSSMNAMIYMRGRPRDYDGWRDGGCPGWGWDDVLPYFKRAERNERGPSELHGGEGPLNVTDLKRPNQLSEWFVDAAAEALGVPKTDDLNGPEPEGASTVQVTQKGGRRFSAADAYLRPTRGRGNLDVRLHAAVTGLELDGGRAVGVRLRGRRGEDVVRAEREVLLAAGAIGSPQLLMLSGLGPADHLRSVGIEPVAELRGVGANLQDHPFCILAWETSEACSLYGAEKPRVLLQYLLRHEGLLCSNVGEACAFRRIRREADVPEIQFHFAPGYFHQHGFDKFEGHSFSIGPALVHPRSRGSLRLRSADPAAKPLIAGNHLTDPQDAATMLEALKLARRIAATSPLAEVRGRELHPGESVQGDDELETFMRRETELLYHPVGTCRMGSDEDAVVDPELRVRGVEGLRVIDASVMPAIPGGNTHAPTVMIAERGSDLIRGRPATATAAAGAGAA